jgi:O-antigen/teichoic acid export membrane protein
MNRRRNWLGRLRWLIEPGESLGWRATNAGAWAFALSMVNRLLTIIRSVVLARLLSPEDFGLMGIAMLVIGLITSFTQTGFNSALVQSKRGLEQKFLDTAWTVEAVRTVTLGAAMAVAAPLVGSFFDSPDAVALVRFLGVGVAVGGFVNTGVVSFDKDLEFQRRFVFRSVPNVVDLAVSVVLAIILGNAWALAFGWVAGRLAMVAASYIAHPHRPRVLLDREAVRSMWSFGVWTLASHTLIYFTLNLDDIVVGRVIDATALGLYTMAFTISQLTTTEITSVVNQVAFPAYARLQDSPPRLARAYTRTVQLVALASFPVAAGLWFVGPTVIELILGRQWIPMVPAFSILVLWGLIRSLLATTGPLFRGMGRPSIATKIQAAQLAILGLVIYPLTSSYGIVGAAWATVIAAIGPDLVALVLAARVSTAGVGSVVRVILFPAAHSAAMLLVLLALDSYTGLPDGFWLLVWAPIAGLVIYVAGVLVSRARLGYLAGGILPGETS